MRLTQQSVRNIKKAETVEIEAMCWGECPLEPWQVGEWGIRWKWGDRIGYGVAGEGQIMTYTTQQAALRAVARIRG